MSWGKETGTAFGRGFNSTSGEEGFAYLLKQWFVKSFANGGSNWIMHDDQSGLGTDPYFVVKNQTPSPEIKPTIYLRVLLPTATSGQIQFIPYRYWNATTHAGVGAWYRNEPNYYCIFTYDAQSFPYRFYGNNDLIFISTRLGSNYHWFVCGKLGYELLENGSSTVTTTAITGAGNNVTVNVSDSTIFTINRRYFIVQDETVADKVNYITVVNKVGNTLTLQAVNGAFASGSNIGTRPHNFVAFGDNFEGQVVYASYYGYEQSSYNYRRIGNDSLWTMINYCSPLRYYDSSLTNPKYMMCDYFLGNNMGGSYYEGIGILPYIRVATNSMAYEDIMTESGVDYIRLGVTGSHALLVRDTPAT